jgi:hypothetical protein
MILVLNGKFMAINYEDEELYHPCENHVRNLSENPFR